MNEFIKILKSRRSIRAYKPEDVSMAGMDAILEAGIYAPSANNQQPWHFTVLRGREAIGKVNRKIRDVLAASGEDWMKQMAADPNMDITYGAPVLIVVSAKKGAGETDCAAAMENMLLAAESMGIGSCWMGLMTFVLGGPDAFREFGVPDGYEVRQAAVFGYPAKDAKTDAPARNMDVVNYVGDAK